MGGQPWPESQLFLLLLCGLTEVLNSVSLVRRQSNSGVCMRAVGVTWEHTDHVEQCLVQSRGLRDTCLHLLPPVEWQMGLSRALTALHKIWPVSTSHKTKC